MEEIKVRELPDKLSIKATDYVPIEDEDGTKKVLVKHFRSLVLNSLYFDNIEELKNSVNVGLNEGDVCQTLGYYKPGDGGAAKYLITYNPAAVEDGKLVHYLSYSDTLRAQLIKEDSINVHQFGAKGDGSTDDTAAIQAAINNYNVVEFNSNGVYVTRQPLSINKSTVTLNGNGATLYPHYVDGITITGVEDIIIDHLDFNCTRASSAVYAYNSKNVNILDCNINNVTSKGIDIKNSEFVNIERCLLDGANEGSLIVLEGDNIANTVSKSSRIVNIHNCKFNNFSKAVHLLSTGNSTAKINTNINLIDCYYKSQVASSSCIYIACPVEIVNIGNTTVEAATTFLYFGGASSGYVSCKDLSCMNTSKMFNMGAADGILNLSGNINTDNVGNVFENMAGKLHSNIAWNWTSKGASFVNAPIGELFDSNSPMNYDATKGYSIATSALTLLEARNMYVDWSSSTTNLNTINNGIKGQLLYIKSSTNKSIVAVTNKIVLSGTSVQLSAYKGILLKYDGLKWIQIQ